MATSMGPPMLPGFSLRVQLFSPNSHALNDKPLRCFRVVSSPEATVREFCEEASRVHEINYGEPIAIKKCQDDQEFDITQTEILGTLFENTATIRLIQAVAMPGVRDSIPPTSALRFDPASHNGRKREREGSAKPNDSRLSSAYRPNKRQRVSDLDPDQPLPSRETDLNVGGTIYDEEEPRDERISNFQRDTAYGRNNGNFRHVRDDPRISETPSPPPELPHIAPIKNGSVDCQGRKSNVSDANDPLMSQMSVHSPFGPASLRAQNAARSKSASYHIQRATERGTSVSTAATSPLSGDQQGAATNGIRASNQRKIPDPILEAPKINGHPENSRSPNVDNIYENVPSVSERSSVLRRTKDKLKPKNGSPSSLYGLDWSKKLNTPPNGSRRASCFQDRIHSNGELPLTPNSKEREERQRLNEQANEATKARIAAAEAAENRAAEDRESTRQMREKSEREAQEKRSAVIAKAAQLEKELVEQMERDQELCAERKAEEDPREQQRIMEEVELAELKREKNATLVREQAREKLEKEELLRIQKVRQEEAKRECERARAEEADRTREEEETRRDKETSLAVEATRKSREQFEQSNTSTPDRSKSTPIRPQASTAFFPSGRKSALKAPSSQATGSSSPVVARTVSAGCSNLSQPDLPPSEAKRRVSFIDEDLKDAPKEVSKGTPEATLKEKPKQTPIKPAILPPSRNSASKPPPKPAPKPAPKMGTKTLIVTPLRQSTTPIPLPPSFKRSSKERSTTPLVQSTIASPQVGAAAKPAVTTVLPVVTKSILPPARSTSQNREISNGLVKSKEPTKPASPRPVEVVPSSDAESDEESDEEDEVENEDANDKDEDEDEGEEEEVDEDHEALDGPSRMDPVQALNSSVRSPAKAKFEPEPASEDEEEDEDVEMQDIQSNRSSSRSPIQFNSHTTPRKPVPDSAKSVESASSVSDTSNDEEDSEDEEKSGDDEEESEDEDENGEDKMITAIVSRSSPPTLPATKATFSKSSERKSNQRKNLTISPGFSTGDESFNTQDEVDFQLTSSMFEASSAAIKSTPIPVPSSSSAARPKFAIGASLSDMNAKKPTLGSFASLANSKARPLKLADDDEVESEEESEEESDSDSDNEQQPSQTPPKNKPIPPSDSDNSSSSDSDSDSEPGSVEENADELRNDMSEAISKILSESQTSTQSYDIPSPKPLKGSQSSINSSIVKEKRKSDKSGSGAKHRVFEFSQPKWN